MQTEKPYWLDEAYSSAIADLDVGLVQRNIDLSGIVTKVLDNYFDPSGKYLDFAGGYGLFVRMMRDRGFDFYRHDKYCENIFAKYFAVPTLTDATVKFELVTAFEVLEHIIDPVGELEQMLEVTDSILLTTELLPPDISSINDWLYFVPDTGQHVTFYTADSLDWLADRLAVNYYTDKKFHAGASSCILLTRRELKDFSLLFVPKEASLMKRIGRLLFQITCPPQKNKILRNKNISTQKDYEYIKSQSGHN